MSENGMERRMFVQGRIPSQWLVDQMPEAIWATDGALRFVAVGGAAAGSLGLEPDRVLGTSVYDYFQTTDPAYPPLAAHLHALQGNVERYRFERGGRVFTVTVGPVRHAIGRVVGVVACAADVTELVAAAEQAASRYTLDAIPACVLRLDPEEILWKAGPLSSDELALLQRYPVIGEQILEAVPRFRRVAKLVRHHRERWDGTGYPDGLKGEEIPLGARILAVVDAYNAMTDHRRYKVARSHTDAVAELQRNTGTQFDPAVVQAFLELLEESRSI